MSSEETSTATATPIPLSTVFCAEDADIAIRAANTLDLHAHKFLLSLVSPVFKDMFTLPQPPAGKPGTLPHADVQDPPRAWENILQTIYPTLPTPTIDTLDDLESLLSAARTYEMRSVIKTHKKAFENLKFIREDPLRLYSIACACGMEDQANHVARNAKLLKVIRHSNPSGLKGLNFEVYARLVAFLAERDNEWRQTLDGERPSPRCSCDSWEPLYNDIKKYLLRPHLQSEEVYLRALENRSHCRTPGCNWDSNCVFGDRTIKNFINEMIRKRRRVCDKFQTSERCDKCFLFGFPR